MDAVQQSDEKLWIAVQKNDYKAFCTLFNRYWKKLYLSVVRYTNNNELAEQVVQDVFIVLWKRRTHLKIEKFASYIHVAARYHIFKALKTRKSEMLEYIEDYNTFDERAIVNSGELRLHYNDLEKQLIRSLAPLPKRCQEIFCLSRIEHFSNDEIANKFGISKRSVENQLTIALKHIRTIGLDINSVASALMLFISLFY